MDETYEIEGFELNQLRARLAYAESFRNGLWKLSVCIDSGAKFKINEFDWSVPLGRLRDPDRIPLQVTDNVLARLCEFETRNSDDLAKVDRELVHEVCGQVLCDVEDGDTLSSLVKLALDHECPHRQPTFQTENARAEGK